MRYAQWERAKRMVELMQDLDRSGKSIRENRGVIERTIESEFNWCHGCLLLAVYGLYKNGYVKGTGRKRSQEIDHIGFNGAFSLDMKHAFDALELLKKDPRMSSAALKKELGGEASIYSFVKYFHDNGLLESG